VTRVRSLDHVAVAVPDIAEALPLFRDVLGGQFVAGGDDERLGIRTLQLRLPNVKVELMQPIREDSYLHAYLERRGPGFHHATILVEDVEEAIADLEGRGFEVVDTDLSHDGWRETFVRPRSGFGTLLQIVDTDRDWGRTSEEVTLEDVLAGRAVWADRGARRR
jgi:methylmalonyl-CoA/ethylmalonyl-CoA epimerase